MTEKLLVVGAGGHSKVVADIAISLGFELIGFLDDRSSKAPLPGLEVLGQLHLAPDLLTKNKDLKVFVAIGDNALRMKVCQALNSFSDAFATLIHPSSIISRYTEIQLGTVVMPNVIVNAGTIVGRHVILNTGCSVDHDCCVDDYVHLSPGVHIAGNVRICTGAHLGIGASAIPGISVGEWSTIGAGGVVIDTIPPGVVAVGVPARSIRYADGSGSSVCF